MKFKSNSRNSRLYGDYIELALCIFTLCVLLHTVTVSMDLEDQISELDGGVPVLAQVSDDDILCLEKAARSVSHGSCGAVCSPETETISIDHNNDPN
ncbi:MAG: hypothetical protein MJZ38_06710 [archaeon]|nr:hypothetical protein [archaeon]